jgi:hypothetical protein
MTDADPETEGADQVQPEETPIPEITPREWETARHDPLVKEFVQQAIAAERKLEREGLIFP